MMLGMKRCSVCGLVLPVSSFHRRAHYVRSGVRSACQRCTSRKAQARREDLKARGEDGKDEEALKKSIVRAKTRVAIRRGLLTPGPCAVCGDGRVEAHHEDYDREDAHLHVEWLCRPHHAQRHGQRPWTRQLDLFSGPGVFVSEAVEAEEGVDGLADA
jgi:hypothetical protein